MFKKINVRNSYFYKVNVTNLKEDLNWAYITASNKFNHTMDHWSRGCLTKFFDFYFGDLAKNIVKKFIISKDNLLRIVEYDQVREDNFEKPDLYDLMIGNLEIEVKSSLEKYTNNLDDIYINRRIIIGLYTTNINVPDYRIQVFFVPNEYDGFWDFMQKDKCKCNDLNKHKEFILEKLPELINNLNIYIAGWINRENESIKMQDSDNTLKISNDEFDSTQREYINFFIRETNPLDDLVNNIRKKLKKS